MKLLRSYGVYRFQEAGQNILCPTFLVAVPNDDEPEPSSPDESRTYDYALYEAVPIPGSGFKRGPEPLYFVDGFYFSGDGSRDAEYGVEEELTDTGLLAAEGAV